MKAIPCQKNSYRQTAEQFPKQKVKNIKDISLRLATCSPKPIFQNFCISIFRHYFHKDLWLPIRSDFSSRMNITKALRDLYYQATSDNDS